MEFHTVAKCLTCVTFVVVIIPLVRAVMVSSPVERKKMSVVSVMATAPRARDVMECRIVGLLRTFVVSVVVTTRAAGAAIISLTVSSFLMRVGSVEETAPAAGAVIMSRIANLYSMLAICVVGIMPPVLGVMGSYSVERCRIPVVFVMVVIRLRMAVVFATETTPLVSDVTVFSKVAYSMILVVFVGVIIAPAWAVMVCRRVGWCWMIATSVGVTTPRAWVVTGS